MYILFEAPKLENCPFLAASESVFRKLVTIYSNLLRCYALHICNK